MKEVDRAYAQKVTTLGPERLRAIEKQILLSVVDMRWREHLGQLDHLRSVIHLRGYAQRDPLNEFKSEAFTMFDRMLSELRSSVTRSLMRLSLGTPEEAAPQPPGNLVEIHQNPETGENEMEAPQTLPPPSSGFDRNDPRTWGKIHRNAPCPCGSGQKYKYCHGNAASTAQA
jgi:preprotein translocase subunit SecA